MAAARERGEHERDLVVLAEDDPLDVLLSRSAIACAAARLSDSCAMRGASATAG